MTEANPFFHRGPIRDSAYFFGRYREVGRTLELLRGAQSVSIVGPRRIGKTSLLFQLSNPETRQQHHLPPERFCFVYIDCESWGDLEQNAFYTLLLQEMREALAAVDQPVVLQVSAVESNSYRVFEQAIRTVVGQGIQPVFLLDEFEALSANPHLDAHFFSGLRGLATRHSVAYVTVSTQRLLNLTYAQASTLSSPFFNFFAQIQLRPFPPSEAEALLAGLTNKSGITFTPATVGFLLDLAGPHPFLLQLAAYYAFEVKANKNAPLDDADRKVIRRHFLAEAEPHWIYAWNNLSAEEQKHLALLPLARQSDPEAGQRLEDAGLVQRRDEDFVPLSPAFQAFVIRQSVPGVLQAPPVTLDLEHRIAILCDRSISLTPLEFDLLVCLITHAGQVVSHRELESRVWSDAPVDHADRLKTALKSLRHALGENAGCIQNVRGIGYRFSQAV